MIKETRQQKVTCIWSLSVTPFASCLQYGRGNFRFWFVGIDWLFFLSRSSLIFERYVSEDRDGTRG